MEKYVKAQDVAKAFADYIWSPIPRTVSYACSFIEKIPAANVVEVVRCAECKYDEHCMLQEFVRDERMEPYDKTLFFCADGKRKDGGKDNTSNT